MGDEAPGEKRWSRERWFLTITILFSIQVVVVIWLSGRAEAPAEKESRKMVAHFYTSKISAEMETLLKLMDPTMYAQANREGFSGAVWLDVNPVEHRSAGWSDPPQFLKFNRDKLLSELEAFGRSDPPHRRTVPDRLVGEPAERLPLSDRLKPATKTTFELNGDVRLDELQSVPTRPSIEFDGVLPPSIVLLQVDQLGRVFSVNLMGSSGQPDADRLAMKIARTLQFGVAEGFSPTTDNNEFKNLRRARLTVHWATVPVSPPPAKPVVPPSDPPSAGKVQIQ